MFVCKIPQLTSSIFCLSLALAPLFSHTHAYDVSRLPGVARYPVGYDPDNRTRPQLVQPLTRPQRTDKVTTDTSPFPLHEAGPTPPPSPRRVNARSPVTAEERSRFYNLIAQTSLASLGMTDPVQAYTYPTTVSPDTTEPRTDDIKQQLGIYRPNRRDSAIAARFRGKHNKRWQPPEGYNPKRRP